MFLSVLMSLSMSRPFPCSCLGSCPSVNLADFGMLSSSTSFWTWKQTWQEHKQENDHTHGDKHGYGHGHSKFNEYFTTKI
jgi:hypothetical protein